MNSDGIAASERAISLLFDKCRRALFPLVLSGLILSGGLASSFAGEITSEPTSPAKELTAAEKLKTPYYLTGDWGGLRPALEARGITFDLFETYDFYGNVSGGK